MQIGAFFRPKKQSVVIKVYNDENEETGKIDDENWSILPQLTPMNFDETIKSNNRIKKMEEFRKKYNLTDIPRKGYDIP